MDTAEVGTYAMIALTVGLLVFIWRMRQRNIANSQDEPVIADIATQTTNENNPMTVGHSGEDIVGEELRFKEFSYPWINLVLNDIAIIKDGIHHTPNYTSHGVRFVSVENIPDIENTTKYI